MFSRINRLILIWMLVLTACGPKQRHPSLQYRANPGATGGVNKEGVDYLDGGDTRVKEALKDEEEQPQSTQPGPPASQPKNETEATAPKRVYFRDRLKEFEIARFAQGANKASRFGEHHFSLKVYFRDAAPVEFKGAFQGKLGINVQSGGYTLTGSLEDHAPHLTQGVLELVEDKTRYRSKIFYRAYKATLKVREDKTRKIEAGSTFENQLKGLRENTFGWVHNWVVLKGPSFYLVDIVKVIKTEEDRMYVPPVFSFKGESLRTGDEVHKAEPVKSDGVVDAGNPDVTLVGNSDEESRRMFSITFTDPKSKETNEVMLDVNIDEQAQQVSPDNSQPGDNQPPQPEPEPVLPVQSDTYLQYDLSQPRTAKMIEDFNRNYNLKSVQAAIHEYQTERRASLTNFYYHANPFRKIMETVGRAYDVAPAYAYLTVIESLYFVSSKTPYIIQKAKTSSALGPFQLLTDTAKAQGLRADGRYLDSDERRFFVPSACGAARYVRELVDQFQNHDMTMGILGYYQGYSGAAAAAYCSLNAGTKDRKACANKINNGFGSSSYALARKFAVNFDYTYADIERASAIPKHMVQYVGRKLAVHFISSNMSQFGFADNGGPSGLPKNVMPQQRLNDGSCQQAVQGLSL